MKAKKVLGILLSVAMLSTAIVGCGKSEEPKKEPDKKQEQSGDFTKADGSIIYWSMWDAGSKTAEAIQAAVDDYCEASGNEVKIEWKGRDIQTLIGASIDAGEDIDIYEDDYQRLSTTFADYALDLENMAQEAGYYEKSNEALTSAAKGWAGTLKCIPYQSYASGVVYNKAIFKEVGVKEPKTWDEFLDVCEKIKKAGYNPLTLDGAYTTMNLGYHLARYIGQEGVKDVVNNGKWAETPEVLKMAQDMENLVKKGYFSEYAPASFPEGENEIGFDETAMVINASWVADEITNNTGCDLEWGMFSYPAVTGGVDGTEGMMVGGQGMSINKNSKNAQAAFELIMYLTTGKGDAEVSKASNAIPADPANGEWPEIIKDFKPAFEQATKGYEWACGMECEAEMTPVIQEWGNKLFGGECTAQEFVDGLEAASK